MECQRCLTRKESKVCISRVLKSTPQILVVKVLRIDDKGCINNKRMKLESYLKLVCSTDNKYKIPVEEKEFELFAFIDISGKTLETCFYRTIVKLNEDEWQVKGPFR